MLIIWLQGIWLPLHGYDFADTPLWAGIYMLPLTAGFLIAGPISGYLSDRYGPRLFATGGLLVAAAAFTGLHAAAGGLPVLAVRDCSSSSTGSARACSPRRTPSAIMSSVPASAARRGLGHAGHVPELRHVAVHRHLLLADDRRPGRRRCPAR